jgi:signal transduction histidine kinase
LIGEKNQAEQLAESKQQFLATMSHEIRTPLNAIIGFTEQLTTTELQPRQQKYLKAVRTSGQQLLNTVNDILDYSKIEAGQLTMAKEPFEL